MVNSVRNILMSPKDRDTADHVGMLRYKSGTNVPMKSGEPSLVAAVATALTFFLWTGLF